MSVIFAGEVSVSYSQMHLTPVASELPEFMSAFEGQQNWWCGAAVSGVLMLRFGRQDGRVNLTMELLDSEPVADLEVWHYVVELPYAPVDGRAVLSEWGGDVVADLELLQPQYRVRWHGRGMIEAAVLEGNDPNNAVDHYLIQMWPAGYATEDVLKTSGD